MPDNPTPFHLKLSDPGLPETKLTTTKQRWAREGKFLTGRAARSGSERLPPGQHLVRDWPVLDLGLQPDVARQHWRLRVHGAVENPLFWTWEDFTREPQATEVSDIHCVTTWSRYDNEWQGVSTGHIMDIVRPRPEASHVWLTSQDGYTTNLPVEDFSAEDSIVAHTWQGAPLTKEHGGPVRLVVPRLYFWKSAKWLQDIEFVTADKPGFWEVRGYHMRGDPWAEQRYTDDP